MMCVKNIINTNVLRYLSRKRESNWQQITQHPLEIVQVPMEIFYTFQERLNQITFTTTPISLKKH